jgi:hypothetical protein
MRRTSRLSCLSLARECARGVAALGSLAHARRVLFSVMVAKDSLAKFDVMVAEDSLAMCDFSPSALNSDGALDSGSTVDTPHGQTQGMLGERTWHPITLASEGPARPLWALHASPGECDLKATRLKRMAPRPKYARAFIRRNDVLRNRQTRFSWQGAKCPEVYSHSGARKRQAERPAIPSPHGRGLLAAKR